MIFAENWMKEKIPRKLLVRLRDSLALLSGGGENHFLIPTLIGILVALSLWRPKLTSKLEKVD